MPQTGIRHVEKFHLLFLHQLGARLDKQLYALKGGCNLRFFWKSIRYSHDIDFDVHTVARETLRKNVRQILDAPGFSRILRSSSIELTRYSEAKQTDTTQRWKVQLRTTEAAAVELPAQIEFSRRKFETGVLFEPIDPEIARLHDVRPILASHYGLETALSQKIQALAMRSRTQARDIFDLAQLSQRGGAAIKARIANKTVIGACENALSVSFDQFKSQVVAYLMPEYQEYYGTRDSWESLQTTVINILESL